MREWRDVDYVLGNFGKKDSVARGRYLSYVEAGVSQGRRNDLVGGGLIRSLGRWAEGKGDERILGGAMIDFVSLRASQPLLRD